MPLVYLKEKREDHLMCVLELTGGLKNSFFKISRWESFEKDLCVFFVRFRFTKYFFNEDEFEHRTPLIIGLYQIIDIAYGTTLTLEAAFDQLREIRDVAFWAINKEKNES
jgi:hypothetical protein